MILSDFHTHSSNSGDCDAKMEFQIQSAIAKGIKHLCITEHMDMDYPEPPKGHEDEHCDFVLNYENYKAEYDGIVFALNNGIANNYLHADLEASNSKLPSYSEIIKKWQSGDFNLYFGVELGLQTNIASKNRDFINGKNFDFILGSSHLIDGEDPYYPEYYEGKVETDIFRRYFEYIYENICVFDDFDCYAHLDYIVRYGKEKTYSYYDFSDEIDTILKSLIEKGKGIELNTGGLRNGLKYPNPCPDVLKRYKELGGEIITIGSDAHMPEHIAYNFDSVPVLLKECGFKYYTIFRQRKPEFLTL